MVNIIPCGVTFERLPNFAGYIPFLTVNGRESSTLDTSCSSALMCEHGLEGQHALPHWLTGKHCWDFLAAEAAEKCVTGSQSTNMGLACML
jgi:hypothetical protein